MAAVWSPRDAVMYLVARDTSGATWVTSTPSPGGMWTSWNGLGGYMQFAAAADVDTTGARNVIGVGGDGQIWIDVQDENDFGFVGWTPLVSGTIGGASNGANSAPVIGAYSDPQYPSGTRRLEIFFTNNNGGNGVGSFWSWAQISPGTWSRAQTGVTQTGGFWWAAANSAVAAEYDGRLTGFSLDHGGNLRYARAGKPVVTLPHGDVIGRYQGTASVYKAIPFAQPPIPYPPPLPSLRFVGPQAIANDWGARDAGYYANVCPQGNQVGKGNEDCLYLNVFAPSGAAPGSTPVMVYIHGGGNYNGSALGYDAASLVNRAQQLSSPVVVVTIQYRIGVFGFLAYPGQSTGNFAYLDQIAALQWVNQNISRFGGDPTRVTIFGQSAGAHDVQNLTSSPLIHGQHLFSGAIMESGATDGFAIPLAQSLAAGTTLAQAVGCTQAPPADWNCLQQSISTVTLVNFANAQKATAPIATTIDGSFLKMDEASSFAQNLEVPIILGSNHDEAAVDNPNSLDDPNVPETPDAYTQYVDTWFAAGQYWNPANPFPLPDGIVANVLSYYPANPAPPLTTNWQQIALDSDESGLCPTRFAARIAAGTGHPVYRYLFTHAFSDPNAVLSDGVTPLGTLGAFHTAELPYVFGSLGALAPGAEPYRASAAELQLSDMIISYWTHFASTQNPNGGSNPVWPAYTSWSASSDPYLQLDLPPTVMTGYHIAQCDFWAQWE
jgi:para-nitrobenzyl esterase